MANTDYEGSATEPRMPQRELSRYTLMARFPDPDSARQAIDRLRRQGLAGNELTLLGTTGDVVQPGSTMTESDRRVVGASARGVVWGVVAGAIIGAIVGVIVLAIPPVNHAIGHVSAGGYVVAAIIGAIIGLTLGGLTVGIGYLDRSKSGEESYGPQVSKGQTFVGTTATGERLPVIAEALRRSGAVELDRDAIRALAQAG